MGEFIQKWSAGCVSHAFLKPKLGHLEATFWNRKWDHKEQLSYYWLASCHWYEWRQLRWLVQEKFNYWYIIWEQLFLNPIMSKEYYIRQSGNPCSPHPLWEMLSHLVPLPGTPIFLYLALWTWLISVQSTNSSQHRRPSPSLSWVAYT